MLCIHIQYISIYNSIMVELVCTVCKPASTKKCFFNIQMTFIKVFIPLNSPQAECISCISLLF